MATWLVPQKAEFFVGREPLIAADQPQGFREGFCDEARIGRVTMTGQLREVREFSERRKAEG